MTHYLIFKVYLTSVTSVPWNKTKEALFLDVIYYCQVVRQVYMDLSQISFFVTN